MRDEVDGLSNRAEMDTYHEVREWVGVHMAYELRKRNKVLNFTFEWIKGRDVIRPRWYAKYKERKTSLCKVLELGDETGQK